MSKENAVITSPKVAIVTGGSRGLGRNTVLNLAKRGVNSIFTYNSNRAEADNWVAAVGETGAKGYRPAAQHGRREVRSPPSQAMCEPRLPDLAGIASTILSTTPARRTTTPLRRRPKRNWTASTTSISKGSSF
jgi:NAD(P)-dependent dehydrogenase (short-subunit alcohol dehydrogenase family)